MSVLRVETVGPRVYNNTMNAKMNDLATALTAAGASVSPNRVQSDTVFCNGYGIFATLTGNVQARNVRDKDDRFTIGKVSDPADVLACNFLAGDL